MKIKDYKLFLESNEDINSICKEYSIMDYTVNKDGYVDVDGTVNLRYRSLTKLPLRFGKVTGYFYCYKNQLTTLEGSPYWVGKNFDCSNNELTTLEGGPKTVISRYYCSNNQLVNFKGFPEDYEGNYVNFDKNPVYKELENIIGEKTNEFIYWCNEFDAIDDQGKVIPERMEEVYQKIGLEYNEED